VKASTVHRCLMVGWGLLLVPTLLFWRQSLIWIVTMSWYANFVGHWSTCEAAKAKECAE
jgi:hypothetical protein